MRPDFDRALKHVLGVEGEFSDHPADTGGATRWGITEAVARRFGYRGAMRDLPLELAKRIYREGYWDPFAFGSLADHEVAAYLFDIVVNHGGAGMARIAQRAVSYRTPVTVDGKWGPNTRGAVSALAKAYPANLLGALKGERWRTYLEIVARNPSQRAFLFGWAKRCA